MPVIPDWFGHRSVSAARAVDVAVELRSVGIALVPGPAVVAPDLDRGDLLPSTLPDIADPQFTSPTIKAKPPWVAESDGEDLGAHVSGGYTYSIEGRRADPRVVCGHLVERVSTVEFDRGVVVGAYVSIVAAGSIGHRVVLRFEVDVDASDRRPKILVDELTVVQRIILIPLVAPACVEVAVRAEVQVATVMVACVVAHLDEDLLGVRVGYGVRYVGVVPARDTLE